MPFFVGYAHELTKSPSSTLRTRAATRSDIAGIRQARRGTTTPDHSAVASSPTAAIARARTSFGVERIADRHTYLRDESPTPSMDPDLQLEARRSPRPTLAVKDGDFSTTRSFRI